MKTTKVQALPWKKCTLGDAIKLQRGFDLPGRLRRAGQIPIVSSSGITDYHQIAAANGPGVVTGRYGTIGEVFYVEGDYWPLNTTLYVKDFKGNSPLFISHLLKTVDFASHSGKSGVPGVNRNDLHELEISLPPLAEQNAIASALSDMDALLAKLDQLIAKKRDIKQAAMQELLTGRRRLPGFSGKWDSRSIGNDIDLLTGFPFQSNLYCRTGIRLLRGSNVKRGQTDWNEEITQYWPEVNSEISRYELQDGDLVIAMDGSLVGRSYARIGKADLPALLLQRVARIRSTSRIDAGYLAALVGSDWFVKHCDAVKTTTAIPHISPADIRSFVIPYPPSLEEQRAIASVLIDMDTEITALEARREKTRLIKQGMMQELLSGRVRLI